MEAKKTGLFANSLIWFGAAVSIAEILTGTLLAPLGFPDGIKAILLGHLIGGLLLFAAGVISGQTGHSAMESVRIGFGRYGGRFFAICNVLQLIGWTAVMIISGAEAAQAVYPLSTTTWCLLIAALIIVWLYVGIRNLGKLNLIAMALLFLLTLWLSTIVFAPAATAAGASILGFTPTDVADGLTFGAAVELAVAMPLSWLPLIGDYTRTAKRPVAASAVSALIYTIVSCWMYFIGLGTAIYTGESDVATVLLKAGLGIVALLIVIFSTVTTTYLDAYSGGVSAVSLVSQLPEKASSIIICIIGAALAIFTPITNYEDFLFLIGSVFAPMIAILLVQYFLLHKDASMNAVSTTNIILWLLGFALYREVLTLDTPVGVTVPVMIIVAIATYIIGKLVK